MSNDEVQIGSSGDEDYEVVPVGPIRKLERRIDDIQQEAQQNSGGGTHDELVRDVLDIMKSNQKIVNDMTESTHELKNSVEDLTHKMDEVVDNMNNFMVLLTEASEMDMEGEMVGDMEGRIADAIGTKMDDVAQDIQHSNQEVIEQLDNINSSLRKAYASQNNNSSPPSTNRSSNNQNNPSQRRNQPQSMNTESPQNRDSAQSRGLNTSGDERMERLKEKFGSKE